MDKAAFSYLEEKVEQAKRLQANIEAITKAVRLLDRDRKLVVMVVSHNGYNGTENILPGAEPADLYEVLGPGIIEALEAQRDKCIEAFKKL